MFELFVEEKENNDTIYMRDMKPYDIGIVVNNGAYKNEYVMRTASNDKFEIMNLSSPGDGMCWTGSMQEIQNNVLKVRLLKPGTKITFIIK